MKKDLETAKKEVETCISQGKQRFNEIITKTTIETKKRRHIIFYSNFYYFVFLVKRLM